MKRVGELYEVVVFTASVSKVCCASAAYVSGNFVTDSVHSMEIRFWTN